MVPLTMLATPVLNPNPLGREFHDQAHGEFCAILVRNQRVLMERGLES